MNFVFGFDEGFVMPTAIAILSLDRFLGPGDRITLLHDMVSDESLDRMCACASNASITTIDCHEMLEQAWKPPRHVTSAAFLRYVAPELLPEQPRCVYVDGDVLFRKDPTPLYNTNLKGRTLGAVRSRVAPFMASPGAIAPWLDMGIPSTAPYFNSGVLVMDLDRWRSLGITKRITEVMKSFGDQLNLADQDALNASVINDWTELDREWNYLCHVAESFLQQPELEPLDPCIVHFAGRSKPWLWGDQPLFAEEWHALLRESPWNGFALHPPKRERGLRAFARRTLGRALSTARDAASSGS